MSVVYYSSTTSSAGAEIFASIFASIFMLLIFCAPLCIVVAYFYGKFREAKAKRKSLGVTLQTQILELAHAKGGTLTIPEVSMNTDLSLEESEQLLDSLVKCNFVNLRVSNSGAVLYDFPRIV
ncbi:hypothetical protein SAMN03159341_102292 [Paenibacillus sp. 1_12]|uniref:hypothetical protein n=1 Tax=Paenibacillus sp. 1_12 TaxID=1566278 RepID=UPI0008ECACEC|nr:hypothetical protein [Paenibacillus sp. 1_12]SFK94259.1 hypothetical protein SAMN03159341_102292 [Paenibacillus sp. 1_12]